jgi:2,4-dienoyl-CoA reductase-like NADH-dependent reductase (Old Yellow Enzyme family)
MAELFEHTSIGSMSLHNRFVRSATWKGMADRVGDVTPEGQSSLNQLAVQSDRFLAGLRDMALPCMRREGALRCNWSTVDAARITG